MPGGLDTIDAAGRPTDAPIAIVAGEALVDRIVDPAGIRLERPGGSPYTIARTIARLGVPTAWLGTLSSDDRGRMLRAVLAADGVGLELVRPSERPTTVAVAEIDAAGTAAYRFELDGTAAPDLDPDPVPRPLPPTARAFVVGSLGLVLEPMASTIVGLVASLDVSVAVIVDPNARPTVIGDLPAWRDRLERVLRRAQVVRASVDDLAALRPDTDPWAAVRWLASLGPRLVVATDGAGPIRAKVDGTELSLDPDGSAVVDTVGAGDVFTGALVARLLATGALAGSTDSPGGATEALAPANEALAPANEALARAPEGIVEAIRFAARAAAFACGRVGAEPPTLADLARPG